MILGKKVGASINEFKSFDYFDILLISTVRGDNLDCSSLWNEHEKKRGTTKTSGVLSKHMLNLYQCFLLCCTIEMLKNWMSDSFADSHFKKVE